MNTTFSKVVRGLSYFVSKTRTFFVYFPKFVTLLRDFETATESENVKLRGFFTSTSIGNIHIMIFFNFVFSKKHFFYKMTTFSTKKS